MSHRCEIRCIKLAAAGSWRLIVVFGRQPLRETPSLSFHAIHKDLVPAAWSGSQSHELAVYWGDGVTPPDATRSIECQI